MADHIPESPKVKPPGASRPPVKNKKAPAGTETWQKLFQEALEKGATTREASPGTRASEVAPTARMYEGNDLVSRQDLSKLGDPELILGAHGGDRRSSDFSPKAKKIKWGETTEYLIARLKRDAPAIAEGLARGEYRSVRQAAIAAGIVKVPSALQQAKRLVNKLGPAEREELQAYLEQVRAPPGD